jgi:anthranilate phosphoribosyltransferase
VTPHAIGPKIGDMHDALRAAFSKITSRRDLTVDESRGVFTLMMHGQLAEATIAAFLGALAGKGECVDELVGAAEAMRGSALQVRCDAECIDTCGTGGDGLSTFNASTTAAIVAAAAGATVAKHGNRSTSRVSGSSEVLTCLGIDIDADRETVERSLTRAGIGYLNARLLHPAMKYAAPVRQAIPGRTIFNLLGPLTNPAGARRQIVGVPRPEFLDLVGNALLKLGASHAWVVHGEIDEQPRRGLCDITVTGRTKVAEVKDGKVQLFTIEPAEVGVSPGRLDELIVASPEASADLVVQVLGGRRGAARDHTLLNAGAALVVAGLVDGLRKGVALAAEAIDNGRAAAKLDQWRQIAGVNRSGVAP